MVRSGMQLIAIWSGYETIWYETVWLRNVYKRLKNDSTSEYQLELVTWVRNILTCTHIHKILITT